MKNSIHRRSITITENNHNFICKVRGEAICRTYEIDYTTTLNKMLEFAIENGFQSKDLEFIEQPNSREVKE